MTLVPQTQTDEPFRELLEAMHERFAKFSPAKGGQALVLAKIDAKEIYLGAIPEGPTRQHYNCSACKRFLESYGALAVVQDDGALVSALWPDEGIGNELNDAVCILSAAVAMSSVSNEAPRLERGIIGLPKNHDPKRSMDWEHFHIDAPSQVAPPEARARVDMIRNIMETFPLHVMEQTHALLVGGSMPEGQRHVPMVEWAIRVTKSIKSAATKNRARNLTWKHAIEAPPGYCNLRGGALGALMEDVAAGKTFHEVKRRYDNVVDPLKYQRPEGASMGQLAQAEMLVTSMGIAASLRRRRATLAETQPLWTPLSAGPVAGRPAGSVFEHVRTKGEAPSTPIAQPQVDITWSKFRRDVLPTASTIEVMVPSVGNYLAMTAPTDPDAPLIMQWDNAIAHYVYHQGSRMQDWNLGRVVDWVAVSAIVLPSWNWTDETAYDHLGRFVLFALKGCTDQRNDTGCALFPSLLKSDLHGARAAIEAYSQQTPFEDHDTSAPMAAGLCFNESRPVLVRVNKTNTYRIDRME